MRPERLHDEITADYTDMIYAAKMPAVLVNAIQRHQADNDNLRAQLKAANTNDAAQDAALDDLRRDLHVLKAAIHSAGGGSPDLPLKIVHFY